MQYEWWLTWNWAACEITWIWFLQQQSPNVSTCLPAPYWGLPAAVHEWGVFQLLWDSEFDAGVELPDMDRVRLLVSHYSMNANIVVWHFLYFFSFKINSQYLNERAAQSQMISQNNYPPQFAQVDHTARFLQRTAATAPQVVRQPKVAASQKRLGSTITSKIALN